MKKHKKKIFLIISVPIIYFIYKELSLIKSLFEKTALWLFPSNEDRNGEFLKIVLSVIGGIGVLYSLHLAYRRLQATNIGLQLQAQAINKQSEQLDLSRKGQVDERFKNAVEHLGNDKEPIILGGIVELHQIAKEEKEKYSTVVFNILTSYLRTILKVTIPRDDNFKETIPQTIIDFLFKENRKDIYKELKGDLSFCNLKGININDCDFNSCDFSFSIMPMTINNVSFENAKLSRVDFTISNLNNVKFTNANFHNNLFNRCKLNNVDFFGIEFYSQIFINSKFDDCKFHNLNLYKSKFICCHFKNVVFFNSEFLKTEFLGTNFINSELSQNKINNVDYVGCGFSDLTFDNEFFQCNFSGVQLKYDSEYIQLEDIRMNIGKPEDKSGILELTSNLYLNCSWKNLTQEDYVHIQNLYSNSANTWKEEYEIQPKK